MKKLILVRHGHYDGPSLTSRGIEAMRSLRGKLEEHLRAPFALHSSTAKRAKESAGHLVEDTGIVATDQRFLYSDNDNPIHPDKLYALMETTSEDVLVVVTHYEWVNYFPQRLADRDGWRLPASHPSNVDKGEAIIIDLESKTTLHVQPTYAS